MKFLTDEEATVNESLNRARLLGSPTHVGGVGYAAVPVVAGIAHDPHCCASRGCHQVCSHLCGTDLATHGCCAAGSQFVNYL